MALHHRFDAFHRPRAWPILRSDGWLMADALHLLAQRGHKVTICRDPERVPDGDLLILHVDASVVPEAYLAVARRFPIAINDKVANITKRKISRLLVQKGDPWSGAVIVKSDLNAGGGPERRIRQRAKWRGQKTGLAPVTVNGGYRLFDRTADVPEAIWADPAWVVEQFVPEREGDQYLCRVYVFCGAVERCRTMYSDNFLVKGSNIKHFVPSEVPDELRDIRQRMGFDFGKFDFVLRDGKPVVFDVNKTPGGVIARGKLRDLVRAGNEQIADGIEGYLV